MVGVFLREMWPHDTARGAPFGFPLSYIKRERQHGMVHFSHFRPSSSCSCAHSAFANKAARIKLFSPPSIRQVEARHTRWRVELQAEGEEAAQPPGVLPARRVPLARVPPTTQKGNGSLRRRHNIIDTGSTDKARRLLPLPIATGSSLAYTAAGADRASAMPGRTGIPSPFLGVRLLFASP